jgi:hypothetical protein
MKTLFHFLFLLLLTTAVLPLSAQDSVADAARATKAQKQGTAKKVFTDEDMPGKSSAASGDSPLDSDWQADLDRMHNAYKQVCSDPANRNAKSLSSDQQKLIDDSSQPLKARMVKQEEEMNRVKEDMEKLKLNEEADVIAAARKGGTMTEEDKRQLAAVHDRYNNMRKEKQMLVAEALQRSEYIYKAIMALATECTQAPK